ncbi:trichohyalin-like [Macrobrachium rosenbergii]|uniref:trichohyalin-like n=1 Tax=Macrobrachium rosenbergii TaxID=79674 RepID=UPI0034D74245
MQSKLLQVLNMALALLGLPQWFGCRILGGNRCMDIVYKLVLFLGTLFDLGNITGTTIISDQKEIPENSEGTNGQDSLVSRSDLDSDFEFLEILVKTIDDPYATEFPRPSLLQNFKRNFVHEIVNVMKKKTERLERENSEYRRIQKENERRVSENSHHARRTIRNLQKEVAALVEENQKTKSEMEGKIRLLLEERNRLENGNVEKDTKIEYLEKEKRDAWNTITFLESSLKDLKEQITALTVTAQKMETSLEEDARRKSDSKTKADEEVSKESGNGEENGYEELKREIAKLREEMEQLRRQVNDQETRKLRERPRRGGKTLHPQRSWAELATDLDSPERDLYGLLKRDSETEDREGYESDLQFPDSERRRVANENETPEETGHERLRKGHKMQFWKKWKNKRKLKRKAEHDPVWEELGKALLEEWQQLSHSEEILEEEIGELLEELEELLAELEEILREEEETAAEEEAVDLLEVIEEMIEEEMNKIVEETQAERWPERGRKAQRQDESRKRRQTSNEMKKRRKDKERRRKFVKLWNGKH